MTKKALKDVMELGKLSIATSTLGSALGSVGANTTGLTNISNAFPAMGTLTGASMLLRQANDLQKRTKKKRYFE